MKIVFIYGPPAAGKLTVAEELVKLTKYKLYHNHLSADLLHSVLKFRSEEYLHLNELFRSEILKAAAKQKVKGIIMTFCYAPSLDKDNVKNLIKLVNRIKGKIHFVYLRPEDEELFRRVAGESRKRYKKLKDVQKLKVSLKKWDFPPIPFTDNLLINNTNIPAKKVAQIIKKHYRL
ncbi:MAG: AAA family ATPase [Candidatus Woesearchaeota archaeon]|jgi:predicted kinase